MPQSATLLNRKLVYLKHKATGQYLHSFPVRYNHAGSSAQQVVGCLDRKDDAALWLFKPEHSEAAQGDPAKIFESEAVVRVEHRGTAKNLHSHNASSPEGSWSEATVFGARGIGDGNDNWRLSILQAGADSIVIRLQHAGETAKYLVSAGTTVKLANQESVQLVGTKVDVDADSEWIVEDPGTGAFHHLEPFASLSVPSILPRRDFYSFDELNAWATSETDAVQQLVHPLQGHPKLANFVREFRRKASNLQSEVAGLFGRIDAPDGHEAIKSAIDSLQERFRTRGLLLSLDPQLATYHDLVKAGDSVTAGYFLAALTRSTTAQDATIDSMRGVFLACRAEYGALPATAPQPEQLQAWEGQIEKVHANAKQRESAAANLHSSVTRQVAEFSKQAADLLADKEGKFKTLENTYDKHMSLAAAVTYWSKKAKQHLLMAAVLGVVIAIAGLYSVAYLIEQINGILFSTPAGKSPEYWRYFAVLLIATFVIWGLRILVQLFMSNFHQGADAQERVTMIKTFLALMKEGTINKERDSALILNTLFRPGVTGLVKEDGSPSTPLEILMRTVSDKASDK